eukprot:scaffold1339_cov207-Alexandrium_tamarense.AAC.28
MARRAIAMRRAAMVDRVFMSITVVGYCNGSRFERGGGRLAVLKVDFHKLQFRGPSCQTLLRISVRPSPQSPH